MSKVLIGALFVLLSMSLVIAEETSKSNDSMMMMKKDDSSAMMKKDDSMAMKKTATESPFGSLSGLGSQVVGFTTEKDAQTLAKTQTVVYFFAASWCPDCKAAFKDISANFTKIPKNVTIVFVNYDKSEELKKKYGVTYQHTFVSISDTGAKKIIWNGTKSLRDILAKVGLKI